MDRPTSLPQKPCKPYRNPTSPSASQADQLIFQTSAHKGRASRQDSRLPEPEVLSGMRENILQWATMVTEKLRFESWTNDEKMYYVYAKTKGTAERLLRRRYRPACALFSNLFPHYEPDNLFVTFEDMIQCLIDFYLGSSATIKATVESTADSAKTSDFAVVDSAIVNSAEVPSTKVWKRFAHKRKAVKTAKRKCYSCKKKGHVAEDCPFNWLIMTDSQKKSICSRLGPDYEYDNQYSDFEYEEELRFAYEENSRLEPSEDRRLESDEYSDFAYDGPEDSNLYFDFEYEGSAHKYERSDYGFSSGSRHDNNDSKSDSTRQFRLSRLHVWLSSSNLDYSGLKYDNSSSGSDFDEDEGG